MATLENPTKEEIKNRIDKSKDNFIDSNELTNFIFDENEWGKNLTDLWNYLNNRFNFPNFDEIKIAINNFFVSTERIDNYNKKISEKVKKNTPLNKNELSLMYLKMVSDRTFNTLPMASNNFTFDVNKPIDQICNWVLIDYIRNEYRNRWYLSTNPSNELNKINQNIWLPNTWQNIWSLKGRNQSSTVRPATENEISLIPQSVKNFFSTWCEYLIKWKDYVVKKASWAIEAVWEFVGGIFRTFINFSKIKSNPPERKGKMTYCSRTAQKNAKFFWVRIPDWDAREWVHKPIIDKEHFINTKTKSWNNNAYIDINIASPDTANFADISVESDTVNWRRYWHRAIAFKNDDGQRYVLDPYYSWWYSTKPIPWDKYPRHKKAEQINFYNAPKQSIE